jgi:hypothetical protein
MASPGIDKIVSGGQTGVDQAGLDAAMAAGIPTGGWVPRGRRCETGRIPDRYRGLVESTSDSYPARTRANVADSDGTLLITRRTLGRGSALTRRIAGELGRPCLAVDLDDDPDTGEVTAWITEHGIRTLNVAGSRESSSPGIGDAARTYLADVFELLAEGGGYGEPPGT